MNPHKLMGVIMTWKKSFQIWHKLLMSCFRCIVLAVIMFPFMLIFDV